MAPESSELFILVVLPEQDSGGPGSSCVFLRLSRSPVPGQALLRPVFTRSPAPALD